MLMVKTILLFAVLFLLALGASASGAKKSDQEKKFDLAMKYVHIEHYTEALPLIKDLYNADSTNANLNYLMGVCLLANGNDLNRACALLERAKKTATSEYVPSLFSERRTPIYAYYYLGVCYAQMNRCPDASAVLVKFIGIIADSTSEYVQNSQQKLKECQAKVAANSPAHFAAQDPIYAVQIGAFKQNSPEVNYPKFPNLKCFLDKSGTIRFLVGNEKIRSNAETLLENILKSGLKDAFIVDLNAVVKNSQEITEEVNTTVPASPSKMWSKIEYKVQLGAYRTEEKLKDDQANKFKNVKGVVPVNDGWMTLLTSGNFSNYPEAARYRNYINELGFEDAFIIVFKNGVKISTKEAEKYTSKDF